MFRYQFLYGAILVGLFTFVIMYTDPLAMLLFVMMVCLPVILFLLHHLTAFFLSFSIESPLSITTTKEQGSFYLTAKNRSFFPISHCVAIVEVRHQMLGTVEKKRYPFSIPVHCLIKEEQLLTMPLSGSYELYLKEVVCYSFLSLFKKKFFPKKKTKLFRLPDTQLMDLPESLGTSSEQDGNLFSSIKSGDDPSEVFALREFHDGDALRQIHWKLSSKTDSFIVRENSLPLSSNALVFFSVLKETTKDFATRLDEALSFTLSLGLSFVQEGIPYTFFWYDPSIEQIKYLRIDTEEQCYHAFYELVSTPLFPTLPLELPEEFVDQPYLKIVASPSVSLVLENAYEH